MNNILHIKSATPVSLFISGENVATLGHKSDCVDLVTTYDKNYITAQPLDCNHSNFTFCYEDMIYGRYDCPYAHFIPYLDRHQDIYLCPPPIHHYHNINKLFCDVVGKYFVEIFCYGKTMIIVRDGYKTICRHETDDFDEAIVYMYNKYLVVVGTKNQIRRAIIINLNLCSIEDDIECTQVCIDEDNFSSLSMMHDIGMHGLVYKLAKNDDSITKYFVYIQNDVVMTKNDNLIPFAFLQAIKIKNLALARRYMSLEASDQHMIEYFGDIKSIYPNPYYKGMGENYTIFNGKYKNFTFAINKHMICDIEENQIK